MKKMPTRDTNGRCRGECRDRVFEGEQERQASIDSSGKRYDAPSGRSPSWTAERSDPPGAMGGRV